MLVRTVEVTLLILLFSILIGPILGAKLKVPGLLTLIFLGIAFGPFGLGWLGRLDLVSDLGSIGILYLMFLAGLGFNLNAFMDNRRSAITLGVLSFVFPFALSVVTVISFYEAGLLAAALVGAMWASNTLVAYPDVRAAGLEDTRPVRDAVSAGVVADVLSLLILAFVTSKGVVDTVDPSAPGAADVPPTSFPLLLSIPVLGLFTLWVIPKVGAWFFSHVGRSRILRLLFALCAMTASASIAVVTGLEGIIGAFLGGIGMNRLVPNNSELMDRIDFLGSTIFIPAFLVSIGLRIDPRALLDIQTVGMGIAFTGLVVVGKTLAVAAATPFAKYTFSEGGLIATLSFGQAASTLAIAQVGLELGLFGQRVVNASVLAIVFTALITSFGTQFFLKKVPPPTMMLEAIGLRVLVDARSRGSDPSLTAQFAGRIARGDDGVQMWFNVAPADDKINSRQELAGAVELATAAGYDVSGVARVSESYVDGALELIDESEASFLVLHWSGPRLGSNYLFGGEIETIGRQSNVPIAAVHLLRPWSRLVVVPGNTETRWHTEDARLALRVGARLKQPGNLPLVVIGPHTELAASELGSKEKVEYEEVEVPGERLLEIVEPDDLVIAPSYLLPGVPLARRIRLASGLADSNLAIVAGPKRLTVSPGYLSYSSDSILGPTFRTP